MTQPARKKETATPLALLEAELTAARRVTARYRAAVEKAEASYDDAREAEADVRYRYDKALVASWGDTPDWLTLLDGDESRSSVMYELACRGLEQMGLGTSMINMDTGQRVVWLGFSTDSEEELQQTLRGVQFILPFVKAGSGGEREISIRHPRADAFALSLTVDVRTQAVSVVKQVYGREEARTRFPGVEAALRYIRDTHSDTSIESDVQHALLTS
ncbi:hypothetical protein B5864_16680 [Salmonella enterica]|uniref:Uncharacterized protein n=2 Tax=Salmonella enterica TaxID=28901 RepID=A0A403T229_SALER|nr:hypothetical protein [Salmonella sp. SG203]EAB7739671.1 hypothetical protein [Salmonella enterica subsp. enterica serovar Hadar]EAV6572671.1 hypothetical protein [Salmonella enterica]EBQ9004619.1 hypothetical protein [Salmonella enterica subsp. enterica serovar Blockley]EBR8259065.1 hypothetical protein [Salmonella enterica subsp. enterica serovar Cerro]EBW7251883.1 hypothetical protein [Salmonella enterica subsp. enterica serovar Gatow]EBX7468981.1 hypothetical protein [Salmonella enteric